VVLPGDNIADPAIVRDLLASESPYSIAVTESQLPSKYGVVLLKGKQVMKVIEKPQSLMGNLISTGIFHMSDRIFEHIRQCAVAGHHDITAVLQTLLDAGERIAALKTAARWSDVVYPWDLLDLNARVLTEGGEAAAGTIESGVHMRGNVQVGEGSVIRSGSYIEGPVRIGRGCDIGPHVCILPSASIGDNVTIQSSTEIRNSLIMNDVTIGPGGFISHSVIGDGSRLGAHFVAGAEKAQVVLEKEIHTVPALGVILGEDTSVGNCVTVESGVFIGSSCRIGSLKNIAKNIPDNSSVV
jgi:glucose-1-phosphate thymidylyltransferase